MSFIHKRASKTFVGKSPSAESSSTAPLLSNKLLNQSPPSVNPSSSTTSPVNRFTIVFGVPPSQRKDNLEKQATTVKSIPHQTPKPSPLTINKLRLKKRASKHHEESLCKFIEDVNECAELNDEDKVEILLKQLSQYLSNRDRCTTKENQQPPNRFNEMKNHGLRKSEVESFCSSMGIFLSDFDIVNQNDVILEDTIFQHYSLLATMMEEESSCEASDRAMDGLLEQLADSLPKCCRKSVSGVLIGISQFVSDCLNEDTSKTDISISFHSILKNLVHMSLDSKYYCAKQVPVKVDGISSLFTIPIDGCVENFGKGYLFSQVRADREENWENLDSDLFKILMVMKSSLVHNLLNSTIALDEVENKTKNMALIVNKAKIHLLVLDACPPRNSSDDDCDTTLTESTIYIKNFQLFHKEFSSTDLDSILSLVTILSTRLKMYSPNKTAQREKTEFVFEFSENHLHHLKSKHCMSTTFSNDTTNILFNRKVLKYIGESDNHSTLYSIASNSILKKLSTNEKYIIGLLLSHSDYSKQLPFILFNNNTVVEMELLESIEQDVIWDETTVLLLILDIASALRFLHKRNICHLNVNPSNIKRRGGKLSHNFICFVLQDFEYCVHFTKEGYRLFDIVGQDYLRSDLAHLSPMFKAPEIDGNNYFHVKADIYSLGTTILSIMNPKAFEDFYESATSRNPQCKVSDWGPLVSKLTSQMSFELRALLMTMVDPVPHDRPSAADIERELKQHLNSVNATTPIYSSTTTTTTTFDH